MVPTMTSTTIRIMYPCMMSAEMVDDSAAKGLVEIICKAFL
jgi:hypothetical protein